MGNFTWDHQEPEKGCVGRYATFDREPLKAINSRFSERNEDLVSALSSAVHWALSEEELYRISYKYLPRDGNPTQVK